MSARLLRLEFSKMRRLRMGLSAAALVCAVSGLSIMSAVSSPEFSPAAPEAWAGLLTGLSLAVPVGSPLTIAVLASRQVDIEHRANGWLLARTAGVTTGRLCRTKFAATAIWVAGATVLSSLLVAGFGLAVGITALLPVAAWALYTLLAVTVSLVVLALHVVLATVVDNQLVTLGLGVVGTLIAMFANGFPPLLAHLSPWGYYALAMGAAFVGDAPALLTPAFPSVAALAVVGSLLFVLTTGLLDLKED